MGEIRKLFVFFNFLKKPPQVYQGPLPQEALRARLPGGVRPGDPPGAPDDLPQPALAPLLLPALLLAGGVRLRGGRGGRHGGRVDGRLRRGHRLLAEGPGEEGNRDEGFRFFFSFFFSFFLRTHCLCARVVFNSLRLSPDKVTSCWRCCCCYLKGCFISETIIYRERLCYCAVFCFFACSFHPFFCCNN